MKVDLTPDQVRYIKMLLRNDLEVISDSKDFLPDRIVAEEILELLDEQIANA